MKTKFLFLTLIFFLFFPIFLIQAASSGPLSPGTLADDASVGAVTWSDTSNASASDDAYAYIQAENQISHYLKASNFGFSIPAGATINGIEAFIEHRATTFQVETDSSVRLLQGGSFAGNNKANATAWSTAADQIFTYGGTSDTWGLTWTADQINSSSFGIGIAVADTDESSNIGGDAKIDYITITVHYTEAVASSTSNPKKTISYPSYTTNFSPSGNSTFVSETINGSKPIEYINNYPQSQTSSPKALSTPPISVTPTPIASDTAPTVSNPEEQDIINQLWNLYLELKRQVEELVAHR